MANDSNLFHEANNDQHSRTPLYEAKFIEAFDHRFAGFRDGKAARVSPQEKRNPEFSIRPRWWVDKQDVFARSAKQGLHHRWMVGFRDITGGTNKRTAIFSVFPKAGAGNTINLVLGLDAKQAAFLAANGNSFVFDYACRQKMTGVHLNIWIAKQLPLVHAERYAEDAPWSHGVSVGSFVIKRVLELIYTSWDLSAFGRDLSYFGPPFRWDDARRFVLRCELDAAYFHLYGIRREDAEYILDTFPIIVKRRDEDRCGDYRTKLRILKIYDDMKRAIESGEAFRSSLDPPPADPLAAHPESSRPEGA